MHSKPVGGYQLASWVNVALRGSMVACEPGLMTMMMVVIRQM